VKETVEGIEKLVGQAVEKREKMKETMGELIV
jgi:hypothetical protein